MDTKKFNKGKTLMVAHRGLSGIERENTNAAFIAAGNRSYFGIETDVHVTKDGRYVVCHDASTGRIALDKLTISDTTYDLLRAVQLTDTDGRPRTDLHIAPLEEYIRICKRYEKKCVLELKDSYNAEQIAEIIEIIKEEEYLNDVIFISFDLQNLLFLREQLPDQAAQYLVCEINEEVIEVLKRHRLDVDVLWKALTEEMIAFLHENGIKINVWTVDDAENGEKLASWGVDYITSNILE